MIASDPLPEGAPSPVTGGSWVDGPTLLLPPTNLALLLGDVENSPAAGSWYDEDEICDNITVLGETFVATVTDETATMQVFEDVIDETEEKDSETIRSCFDEDEEWGNVTILGDTLVANTSVESAAKEVLRKSGAVDVIGETEVLVTSGTEQSKYNI